VNADELEAELAAPQFEPLRTNGELRRYRFPSRKAQLIAAAQEWLYDQDSLTAALAELESDGARRKLICQCPGIGLKSASWLLRNTGWASELAILDIHVIRAMEGCGRIRDVHLPRDYERVEQIYLAWCDEIGSDPARFDLVLWDFSRQR
jgi:thermostable 8-oxoguanine DNA glycosylase